MKGVVNNNMWIDEKARVGNDRKNAKRNGKIA